MSGIVALFHRNGKPIDPVLLDRITRSLSFRGPDAQGNWRGGPVGLGHTLLSTTFESQSEHQPLTLDGETWITADARIDARENLLAELQAGGRAVRLDRPDAELVLHAYQAWGEDCVQHLLGDFAFVIWDGAAQKLFAARDHFGVKPLYYANTGDLLVLSNTLAAVRMAPGVGGELNDLAVADFLLFAVNQELDTTIFAAIRRLPPASALVATAERLQVTRYWTLPDYPEVRYRREEEYLEHFRGVFGAAVRDRIRCREASAFLSGGLDSPTVAAFAAPVLRDRGGSLTGIHATLTRLLPDQERVYTDLVAKGLGVAVEIIPVDDIGPFDWRGRPGAVLANLPEPSTGVVHELVAVAARHGRILLTGHAGDSCFNPSLIEVGRMARSRRLPRLLAGIAAHFLGHGELPRVGLRTRIQMRRGHPKFRLEFPAWVPESLIERYRLKERWAELSGFHWPLQYRRPEAYAHFLSPWWPEFFESVYDPAASGALVELVHPFIDLRVIELLLGLPTLPWCIDKRLLREHGRGMLPAEVLSRPKAPLRGDPIVERLKDPSLRWVDDFEAVPGFERYVVRDRVPALVGRAVAATATSVHLRPFALNAWLSGSCTVVTKGWK